MQTHARKTAWIIGASSGLGAALAIRLANEGYQVGISARREERLNAIAAHQSGVTPFPLDVGDHGAVQRCAESILAEFGHIDLLVFCAVSGGSAKGMHESLAQGMFVGLLGATAVMEPIAANMKKRGSGQIALIGSPVGFRALPGARTYGTVKSALHYLAEAMKIELAGDGIAVQLILPGFVDTQLTQANTFQMPFLMTVDEATDRIWRGLCTPQRVKIAFPRRLIWLMRLFGALPDPVYFNAMKWLGRKIDKNSR